MGLSGHRASHSSETPGRSPFQASLRHQEDPGVSGIPLMGGLARLQGHLTHLHNNWRAGERRVELRAGEETDRSQGASAGQASRREGPSPLECPSPGPFSSSCPYMSEMSPICQGCRASCSRGGEQEPTAAGCGGSRTGYGTWVRSVQVGRSVHNCSVRSR